MENNGQISSKIYIFQNIHIFKNFFVQIIPLQMLPFKITNNNFQTGCSIMYLRTSSTLKTDTTHEGFHYRGILSGRNQQQFLVWQFC